MSGAIAVTANDQARFTLFWLNTLMMRKPPNTALVSGLTSDRVLGRNSCVRQALGVGAEWVLFLDDDHVIPGDTLMKLLARDVDIVGGLYLQRMLPFGPIAYSHRNDVGHWMQMNLSEYEGHELVEVEAVGTGCLLVKSEVFHAMEEPWFIHHETSSEDLTFCLRAREHGFKIHVDLGAAVGHITTSVVWPSPTEEHWRVAFDVSDGCRLQVPLEHPEFEPLEEVET